MRGLDGGFLGGSLGFFQAMLVLFVVILIGKKIFGGIIREWKEIKKLNNR